MSNGRDIWLKTGHAQFARYGHKALKVEVLAQRAGKSRSSFYHQFGDVEEFMEELIAYDLEITRKFATESENIQRLYPEYIDMLVVYKDMIFFNKQLFVGRDEDPRFSKAWAYISSITEGKTMELWIRFFGLEALPKNIQQKFYETTRSAGFSRLEYDNYTPETIYSHLRQVVSAFDMLLPGRK